MKILDIKYDNLTRDEALARCLSLLKEQGKANVFFLNLDCLRLARHDREYRELLNGLSSLVLPDGIGLRLATKFFGGMMKANCNGTDLSPAFIKAAAAEGARFFLLGGREGIAEKAAESLRKSVPGIRITGTQDGYFRDEAAVVDRINQSGANVLFVAMGVPLQEKFIVRNRARLNPRLCLGVGAFLDYLSGSIPRAPQWMISFHIEWLWRIFIDPRRMFRRYMINGMGFFLYLLFYRLTHKLKAE